MILEKAREVYYKSRGTYGSPRIHASLKPLGIQCSRKADEKSLGKDNQKNEEHIAEPNHLSQQFDVTEPNKVWVSDITYVPTEEGWLYVFVSLDLFSRKVVGLSMGVFFRNFPCCQNT